MIRRSRAKRSKPGKTLVEIQEGREHAADPAFLHVTYAAAWPPCDAPEQSLFCSSAACCPPPLAESDEGRLGHGGDAGGGVAPKPAGKALSILVTFSMSEGDIYR